MRDISRLFSLVGLVASVFEFDTQEREEEGGVWYSGLVWGKDAGFESMTSGPWWWGPHI